ncbi:MAG: hypothetical protein IPK80_15935 [Nannocystis sp.]|nr:hypothetical protein [Nannocystis sp.]
MIANSVAYEGIDLQVRTCAIHHVDLTWTPADLEQRNGRGVRQGNTLGLINIYYYFADGSTDGYRFSLIDGKAGWLGQLLTSAVRDTNNPGAQQQLSPEDVLIMISRDKEKTRALIEMKRSQAIEAARARIAREANRVLRQAVSRFDRAREADDPEHAARLREDAEQRLSDLKTVDPAAWPWYPWIHVARDVDMLVPELGAPVYEGLRITRPRVGDTSQLDHFEFGAITDASGPKVGLRLAGSATWQLLTYEGDLAGKPLDPAEFPREGGPVWPLDDEDRTAAAIALKLGNTSFVRSLDDLGWLGASDAFLAKWWPRFNDKIAEAFANAWKPSSVPVVDSEGLAITAGAEVRGARLLPPTLEGWREYLALAPASGESYTTLRELGLAWWGRKIPKRLLADAADADDADNAEDNADNADKPSPPATPSPSPTRTTPPARAPVAPTPTTTPPTSTPSRPAAQPSASPTPSTAPVLDDEARKEEEARAQLAVILREYPSTLPAAATTQERKLARDSAEAVTLGNVEIPRRWTRSAVTEAIAAGIPGDAWDERGNMIAPWDEHLDAWADAWIAVAGDSPKP